MTRSTLEDQLRLYGQSIEEDPTLEPLVRSDSYRSTPTHDPITRIGAPSEPAVTGADRASRRVWWVAAAVVIVGLVIGVSLIPRRSTPSVPYLVGQEGEPLSRYLAPPATADDVHVVVQENGASISFTIDGVDYILMQYRATGADGVTRTPESYADTAAASRAQAVEVPDEGTVWVNCLDTTEGLGDDGLPTEMPTTMYAGWVSHGVHYRLGRSPAEAPTCQDDPSGFLAQQIETFRVLDPSAWQDFVNEVGWSTPEPPDPDVTPTPEVTTTSAVDRASSEASQSAADAARDGVGTAVATAPVHLRVNSHAQIETTEGTWLLSEPTDTLVRTPTPGTCIGGNLRQEQTAQSGCLSSYGEILLLNTDGDIAKAFPMPSVQPTWITATDNYVYAGRQGDGGSPDSSVVRIDRRTLTAEIAIFRTDNQATPYSPVLPGWYEFEDWQLGQLEPILNPAEGSGAEVTSWTHPGLRVDLAAIDALLASIPR